MMLAICVLCFIVGLSVGFCVGCQLGINALKRVRKDVLGRDDGES
jgi:hypothetical protein